MEKKRSPEEKIKKMQELGIFEKWQANTNENTAERYTRYASPKDYIRLRQKRRCTILLREYDYLSITIESSFIFSRSPEGFDYWVRIIGQLREEI